VPEHCPKDWISEFATGLRQALKKWNIQLIGGDTTRSNKDIMVSMSMGSRMGRSTVWRSGAKIDDDVWVTGSLGGAAYGFFHKDSTIGINDLCRPHPPVRFAAAIASFDCINSMTDISDGLKVDLSNICKDSKVGAVIDPTSIPMSSDLWKENDALSYATAFGEDYQMLFTCIQGTEDIIRQTAKLQRVRVTKIGRIIPDRNRIELKDMTWPEPLFSHFQSDKVVAIT
jgi:thiamine-monophosphate kinase